MTHEEHPIHHSLSRGFLLTIPKFTNHD